MPELEGAWLFKIAHNVCLSRRRSTWRRRRVETPGDIGALQDLLAAPQREGDDLIRLNEVLGGMPEQQRRAILLREWQGLSYREIAEELELSQAAVETLIFRARRSLAQGLEAAEAQGWKRTARGANVGSFLAGLKSLIAGSAAVKVAASVAVVATASAVAGAPIEHHFLRAPRPKTALVRHVARRHVSARSIPVVRGVGAPSHEAAVPVRAPQHAKHRSVAAARRPAPVPPRIVHRLAAPAKGPQTEAASPAPPASPPPAEAPPPPAPPAPVDPAPPAPAVPVPPAEAPSKSAPGPKYDKPHAPAGKKLGRDDDRSGQVGPVPSASDQPEVPPASPANGGQRSEQENQGRTPLAQDTASRGDGEHGKRGKHDGSGRSDSREKQEAVAPAPPPSAPAPAAPVPAAPATPSQQPATPQPAPTTTQATPAPSPPPAQDRGSSSGRGKGWGKGRESEGNH